MHVHHLALRTRDLPRLEAFYAGLLGLDVLRRDGARSVWLRAEGAVVMLELAEPGEPEVPARSMEMLAFAIAPEERAEYTRRLELAGVAVEAETPFTTYFRDPDGRRVGVSHYPHAPHASR
jgi:glyoxylase I family protein